MKRVLCLIIVAIGLALLASEKAYSQAKPEVNHRRPPVLQNPQSQQPPAQPAPNDATISRDPKIGTISSPKETITPPVFTQGRINTPPVGQNILNLIKLHQRAPIPYKPFELRDPKTGAAISPETMVTLSNGKTMAARQYYDELNSLEQQFNAAGYTLREPQKIQFLEPSLDQARLQRDTQILLAAYQKFASPLAAEAPKLTTQEMQRLASQHSAESAEYQRLTSASANQKDLAAKQANLRPPKTVHHVKDFNYSLGNPEKFGAYLKGKIELDGQVSATTVHGEADAGGAVFGYSKNILHATGAFTAPLSGNLNARLKVDVLGYSLVNIDESAQGKWSKTGSWSKTVDFSKTVPFALGPIRFSLKVGVQGSAGVCYFAGLYPGSAKAWLSPRLGTSVYVQGGVHLLIVEAGVGVKLTLLKDELNLRGEVAIRIDHNRPHSPYFFEQCSVSNDLEALSGRFYLFAVIHTPWPLPDIKLNATLWRWDGFKVRGVLYDYTKKTYLFDPVA